MNFEIKPGINLFHCDCMDLMRETPDKFYDLCICDPPYGIGEDGRKTEGRCVPSAKWKNPKPKPYKHGNWDNYPPDLEYFNELIRVSKNQIIWGANYFISRIPFDSSCWVIWDKLNGGSDQADCEIAWTSFKTAIRKFEYLWSGFKMQNYENKIHPTQKPVQLYKWLLKNYAKQGDRILDTHLGSGSSAIAAFDGGFDFVGCEIDADYYTAAKRRFEYHRMQLKLL